MKTPNLSHFQRPRADNSISNIRTGETLRSQLIWIIVAVVTSSAAHVLARESGPKAQTKVIVAVSYGFSDPENIKIPVVFENVGSEPICYLMGTQGPKGGVGLLEFGVYRYNRPVTPRFVERGPVLSERNIRILDSGRRLKHILDFDVLYGGLSPARYELRAGYDISEQSVLHEKYGLTPMQFTRTLLFLEVGVPVEENPQFGIPNDDSSALSSERGLNSARDPAVAVSQQFIQGSSIDLMLNFQNVSGAPLRYMAADIASGERVEYLNVTLFRDRDLIEPLVKRRERAPSKDRVRELKPRQYVAQRVRITEDYGDLPAGRYQLRAAYHVPEDFQAVTEHEITPAKFEQTVLFLEIIDPPPPKESQ